MQRYFFVNKYFLKQELENINKIFNKFIHLPFVLINLYFLAVSRSTFYCFYLASEGELPCRKLLLLSIEIFKISIFE